MKQIAFLLKLSLYSTTYFVVNFAELKIVFSNKITGILFEGFGKDGSAKRCDVYNKLCNIVLVKAYL